MKEIALAIEEIELFMCGCILTLPLLSGLLIGTVFYPENWNWGIREILVLAFFFLLSILTVCLMRNISKRSSQQEEIGEKKRRALLARLRSTLEHEDLRLRDHNQI